MDREVRFRRTLLPWADENDGDSHFKLTDQNTKKKAAYLVTQQWRLK